MYHFQVQNMTCIQLGMISSIQIIWKLQSSLSPSLMKLANSNQIRKNFITLLKRYSRGEIWAYSLSPFHSNTFYWSDCTMIKQSTVIYLFVCGIDVASFYDFIFVCRIMPRQCHIYVGSCPDSVLFI